MRVSLDHAHIFASNLDATVGFFRSMFNATVVWDDVVAGACGVRLQIGRAFILIYDQPPKAPRGGAFHHKENRGRRGFRESAYTLRTLHSPVDRYISRSYGALPWLARVDGALALRRQLELQFILFSRRTFWVRGRTHRQS
jgi:catechol 2,3-dioxygenase-like lactoylglutathione lyase family enzyme